MRLPPQLFAAVLSTLRRPNGMDKSEMRRTTRMPVWAKVILHRPDGKGETTRALARDISMEGIGLLAGTPRAKSESFVVELPRDGAEPLFLACMTMHCLELGTSLYSIGACFTAQVHPSAVKEATKGAPQLATAAK